MSVLFDSVLTAALARELDEAWKARRLEALHFDGETRGLRLGFADDAWVWLLHPSEGVPARVARRARRRRPDRGILDGPVRVVGVEAPLDTRRVELHLEGGGAGAPDRLVVDLVTNRWNAILLSGGRIRRTLLPGRGATPLKAGDAWEGPPTERRWAACPPSRDEWAGVVARRRDDPDAPRARACIAWLSSVNEAYVFRAPADAGAGGGDSRPGDAAADASFDRYLGLRAAALEGPGDGWLLGRGSEGPRRPYPHALGNPDAERFDSLVDAFRALAQGSQRISAALAAAVEDPETAELRGALEERRDRAAKKFRALEGEYEAGSEAESIRELGHILLARKNDVPRGAGEVTLTDFGGESITIELDPQRDAAANAAVYYERAKRLDRAVAKLPARIDRALRRVAKLDSALERLESDGPDERLWKLAGGRRETAGAGGRGAGGRGRQGQGATTTLPRLPYRRYRTSGGLEIRAGRSASDNDELTFHHSAPDDIWMHVREAPGSHVVLRWGRKDQNPPESDIAEAALVAAVLSRARGSRLVPVSWTRRKYVRKPRKAGAGTVTVERTQTVFVEPDRARAERMADDEE